MKSQYKKFNSPSDVDSWYKKNKLFFPSDNKTDKTTLKALDLYTASCSSIFNGHLRYNIKISDCYQRYLTQMVKEISTFQIPDNIIVYRYISKGLLKEMCTSYPPKKGLYLLDKGFMSTSLIKRNLEKHRHSDPSLKILLKISVPAGTNGIYVGHLENMLKESEVILAPNTQLRIDYKYPFYKKYFNCTVVS